MEGRVLEGLVRRFIKTGRLRLTEPSGKSAVYGDGTGPDVAVRLNLADAIFQFRLCFL